MQNSSLPLASSRRDFIRTTGAFATASALAGLALPHVHAAGNETIHLALVGCGGRGTGAANDAISAGHGQVKLAAMADVFENRLGSSYEALRNQCGDKIEVQDRKFVGFDAYKNAMDCLKPGDVVILATPPAFRWVHFTYAIEKGLHVFMEKPVTVDGPTSKRMLALGEEAKKKNLKVAVGLMCRHCRARTDLYTRIKDGAIGDIITLRAYRMHGPGGYFSSTRKPDGISDLLYQVQRFHSFLWASGGCYSDFYIHHIDECCWMKDAWPVKAQALGGRHYRTSPEGLPYIDQNFDTYAVEYTFDDGTKLFLDGRTANGCKDEFASYAHGSKGAAVISFGNHTPAGCRIFKSQKINPRDNRSANVLWSATTPEPNAYATEWEDLLEAIRKDNPYNEIERGVKASLVTSMGRMAAHTGQEITFDEMLNCAHEFAPGIDALTLASEAPLKADAEGKYPVPQPGRVTQREY